MRTVSETSGIPLNAPTFELHGFQKKKKGLRKYLERLWLKTSLTQERKSSSSPGSIERPIQDKPKDGHAEIHINRTNKIKYKGKILKATGKSKK